MALASSVRLRQAKPLADFMALDACYNRRQTQGVA